MRIVALSLALTIAASAADSGWLPITGYVKDPRSGTLRPIQGLPGASLLGAPLSVPFLIDQVEVCPGQDFALAVEATELRPVWMIRGLRGDVTAIRLDGLFADRIKLNASCSGALVYSQVSATAQFLTGLPDQPVSSSPLFLATAAGTVGAMELTSDARSALISFSDPAAGGIYLLTADAAGPTQIASAAQPVAMSLSNNGQDVVVADGATAEVFAIRDIQGGRVRQPLMGSQDGLQHPAGTLVLGNGTLFVADAGASAIFEMDLAAGLLVGQTPVAGVPTRIDRLALPDAFALTEVGSGPLLLLDTSQGRNVVFVPMDSEAAQ